MSASILWLPADPRKPKSLRVGAPSAFLDTMQRAGLPVPRTITSEDLQKLEGMAAVFGNGPDRPNPYEGIIAAVREHGSIEIWYEH